ncbi:MAG: hypothetical protein BWX85_00782 [Chloroflexi bacterium ADurb.Bin120]|jgi:hypothetical protein|nr:MAG: hypothetical protein BWX85_00782 [Chloroflexi bacterium ADurb.Bin120]
MGIIALIDLYSQWSFVTSLYRKLSPPPWRVFAIWGLALLDLIVVVNPKAARTSSGFLFGL